MYLTSSNVFVNDGGICILDYSGRFVGKAEKIRACCECTLIQCGN